MTDVEMPIAMDHVTYRYNLVPLDELSPSPLNPRKRYDGDRLRELAESVRQFGVLEPLIVRRSESGYEIVAGERRWRAAKLAQMHAVPCIVRNYTDEQTLEVQVVENNQREDVHPLEECDGFAKLLRTETYRSLGEAERVRRLADRIGRTPHYVHQRIRLDRLIEEAREAFAAGDLFLGHALRLAPLDPRNQAKALDFLLYHWDGGRRVRREGPTVCSVVEFGRWLAREIERDLSVAPFAVGDETLVETAGSCSTCPKRSTEQGLLWDDSCKDVRCLDRLCWDAKLSAHVARRVAAIREEGLDVVVLKGGGLGASALPDDARWVYSWDVTADPNGRVVAIAPDSATETRVELRQKVVDGQGAKADAATLAKRRLGRGYRIRLREAIEDNLPKELDAEAARLLARLTVMKAWNVAHVLGLLGWEADDAHARLAAATDAELLRLLLLQSAAAELLTTADPEKEGWPYEGQTVNANALAKELGINPKAIRAAVEAELRGKGRNQEAGS